MAQNTTDKQLIEILKSLMAFTENANDKQEVLAEIHRIQDEVKDSR